MTSLPKGSSRRLLDDVHITIERPTPPPSPPPKMLRSRFRRTTDRVFLVHLTVHQLDSIPSLHRLLYVHWRARRATPSEGRTRSLAIEPGNVVVWNSATQFLITIPSEPTDASVLQPSPLTLQLRSERRSRWLATASYANEGAVHVDLSEVAALGFVSRNFLLQDSLLNTTLKLSIRVVHQSGDRIFRTQAAAQAPQPSQTDLHDPNPPDSDSQNTPTPPHLSSDPLASSTQSVPASHQAFLQQPYPGARSAPNLQRITRQHPTQQSSIVPSASAPGLLLPSVDPDRLTSANTFAPNIPPVPIPTSHTDEGISNVLHRSIPNPEDVQRPVCEMMFKARIRDSWPAHIEASRVSAADEVDRVYADVCAKDGIGVAATGAAASVEKKKSLHETLANRTDKTLSLEALLESRNGAPPQHATINGASQMPPLVRRASSKSPALSVRSSSMGEIAELAKLKV